MKRPRSEIGTPPTVSRPGIRVTRKSTATAFFDHVRDPQSLSLSLLLWNSLRDMDCRTLRVCYVVDWCLDRRFRFSRYGQRRVAFGGFLDFLRRSMRLLLHASFLLLKSG